MFPAQGRQVLQQGVIDRLAVTAQGIRGPFQVDRVPQHDGGRHQVEAAGPVALLLETAVAASLPLGHEDEAAYSYASIFFTNGVLIAHGP